MYLPTTEYYAVHSLSWIDIKIFSLVIHSIRAIDFSSQTDRQLAFAHLQILYRTNQLKFDLRYPLDVCLISLNLEPFLNLMTKLLKSLSLPNHHTPEDYREYHDLFQHAMNGILDNLNPNTYTMNRTVFEKLFNLRWV